MSRYSPTVLPTAAPSLGDFLGSLQGGADFTMSLSERLRKKKQDEAEFATRQQSEQLSSALARQGAREQGVVQGKAPPTSTGTTRVNLGGGYVEDPDLAERARKVRLSEYLERQLLPWQYRENIQKDRDKAALARTVVQQTGATGRTEMQQTGATGRTTLHETAADRRAKAHDVAMAARTAAGGGGATAADRRTAELQRDRDSKLRRLTTLQAQPEYGTWRQQEQRRAARQAPAPGASAVTEEWLSNYQTALSEYRAAQAAVDSVVHPPTRHARPGQGVRPKLPDLPPLPAP